MCGLVFVCLFLDPVFVVFICVSRMCMFVAYVCGAYVCCAYVCCAYVCVAYVLIDLSAMHVHSVVGSHVGDISSGILSVPQWKSQASGLEDIIDIYGSLHCMCTAPTKTAKTAYVPSAYTI